MQLLHAFFHIFKTISLLSWYLESPHVAHLGKRLANCPHPTLACLQASQNALREYQECERQKLLDEMHQVQLREVQDKKHQAELTNNATLWKMRGEAPPVYVDQRTFITNNINNNIPFYNFCPNDINPAQFFKNLERNCDSLHKLNQLDSKSKETWLRAAEMASLSGKQIPPVLAIDAPDSSTAHDEWSPWFHAQSGISLDIVETHIVTSPKGFLELLCMFLLVAWLVRWLYSKLLRLITWLLYKPAKSVHTEHKAETDKPVQPDHPAQSHQTAQPASPAQFEQVAQRPQTPQAEDSSTTFPEVTTIRRLELRRLKEQANGNNGRENAERMLGSRIEELMQEDLLGEWFTQGMPIRPANAEVVDRTIQAVDAAQRGQGPRRRVELDEQDEL
ncbi:uncharacterized protein N0V89_005473 [Didymosphaeria variabile]|uniref:Uncharacterized protein n=1 Tax=Didymosphaeria variabile TaxID=1932322 RepID=A0A9W8XMB1_9PLEO|nr:uncharacterized protein N0V89_005473 [Didymosphaeria variabile]KAJ4353743.1 hypothetical protein N0V89_005473 [Didymosphaeria variabile]